jgi:hypothetical protein
MTNYSVDSTCIPIQLTVDRNSQGNEKMHAYLAVLLLALASASQLVLGDNVPFFYDIYNNANCKGPKAGTMISGGLPAVNTCIDTGTHVPSLVKGVPVSFVSIRINCPANTFSFGLSTSCNAQRFRLKDLCISGGPNASYKLRCIPDVCKPSMKQSENKCKARIARCAHYGYSLKW